MAYIFVGYSVSTLIHELGHAFALATVGRRIECVGWFIMCGLPGAYIKCAHGAIQSLSPGKQLRVFFAGVWHNVLLTIGICVVLYLWQVWPFSFGLFARSGDGVAVVSVASPRHDVSSFINGIDVGSVIVSLSGRPTLSVSEYVSALSNIFQDASPNVSQPIRIRIEYTNQAISRQGLSPAIRVEMWESGPKALYEALDVVDVRPGALLQPLCAVWLTGCLHLPQMVLLAMYYIASISGGLALINSLPVYWLDGDDALGACLQLLFPGYDKTTRATIKIVSLRLCSALLALALLMSFASLL